MNKQVNNKLSSQIKVNKSPPFRVVYISPALLQEENKRLESKAKNRRYQELPLAEALWDEEISAGNSHLEKTKWEKHSRSFEHSTFRFFFQ